MRMTVLVGLASGAAFFLHAMVPYSHAWPLVWPIVGGIAIEFLTARERSLTGFGQGIRLAGATGLVSALLFFVATVAALSALHMSAFAPLARALGAGDDPAFTATALRGIGVAAALGFVLAVIAGALTCPVARARR